ncbi:MAG: ABC transporter permease [Longimicrobiales bacterium]
MDRFLQDLRFAMRSLRGSPLLTGAALVSLALGIGASAAIFSAVDTFLLKPLEFEDSDRLVFVWSTDTERGWTSASVSPLDYQDWRREAGSVRMAAMVGSGVNMTTDDGAVRLEGLAVSPGFFEILGVSPAAGRGFVPADEEPGAAPVVVLSNEVWQQTFGGDPAVVGRILNLDGQPTQVVGVMPEGFRFGTRQDLWQPLILPPDAVRGSRYLQILARVDPSATVEGARAELGALAARLAETYPDTNTGRGVNLVPVQEEWFDEGFRQGSLIAGAAVLFVLLIACANVANLLLARGADREREIALRSAIGAGRGRIVGQLLTESLILATAGGVLGVGVGWLGMEGIRGLFPPGLPGVHRLVLDGRVLGFTAAATLLAGLLFGVAPALQTSTADLRSALVDGGRGGSGRRGGRLRSALVMGEVGLSVVLLVSAVLLVKAFGEMRNQDLGFELEPVATLRMALPEARYPGAVELDAFGRTLLERVSALPGVEGAATSNLRPMSGNTSSSYTVAGEDPPAAGSEPVANVRYVSPAYFDVLGVASLAGRTFDDRDQADTPPVILVNERMAARHWEGRSPLGARVTIWGQEREVVGVVADTRDWGPDSNPAPMVYAPATQRISRNPYLFVRTDRPLAEVAEGVRSVVRSLDPDQAVYDFRSLRQVLDDDVSGNLAMAKVLGTLALIAFLLSGLGVYGVLAYSVARRTQEMGIRQSLGAGRRDVRALVVRQGLALAGVGIVGGLIVAASTTRLLAFFLFGVSPYDPVAFLSVPAALLATALAASWIPAVRATRVDPIVALRAD